MRILHLYSGNLYGGIERLLVTLARERHHAPDMLPAFGLCFQGRLSDELRAANVPLFDLGAVRFSRPWTVWQARWRLRHLLRREAFDVVMTHAAWPHALFANTVRAAGIPLVHWVHDVLTGPGNSFEDKAARTPPRLVIANSQFTAQSVPKVFPGVRTEVVHLPVSPPEPLPPGTREAVRQELQTPDSDVVILQASRLERWKGHTVLIDALGRMHDLPGWTAWIAGGPQKAGEQEYFEELQQQATQLGIAERVRFLGQRSDVSRLLASADIFCQPNTSPEPFGIAFIEALYAGLPVVTSDMGGGKEIVDATSGILTPARDAQAVENELKRLAMDPTLRKQLQHGSMTRAQDLCDPERQISTICESLKCKTA